MNTKATHNQKSARKSTFFAGPRYEDDILDSLEREDELVAERARVRGVSPAVVALDPDLSVAPRGREALSWAEAVRILAASLNIEFCGMLRVAHHACFFGRDCIAHASTDRDLYDMMVAWAEGYRWALTQIQLRRVAAARRQQVN